MRRLLPVVCMLLFACSLRTEPGPLWASKTLKAGDVTRICLRSTTVSLLGSTPWLEQHARRLWLAEMAHRTQNCAAETPTIQVKTERLGVKTTTDAYGVPSASDRPGAPARLRVSLVADVTAVHCADGESHDIRIEQVGWVTYTADPFLREERVLNALNTLVSRATVYLAAELQQEGCSATSAAQPAL